MRKKRIFTGIMTIMICLCFVVLAGALSLFYHLEREVEELDRGYQKIKDGTKALLRQNQEFKEQIAALKEEPEMDREAESVKIPVVQRPGEVLSYEAAMESYDAYFSVEAIRADGPVFARINGKSYRENDNVALEDLRYLTLLHYNFAHEIQIGEMIVHHTIAQDVLGVFKELFENEYEIQSVFLIDNYWTGDGDSTDFASIEANNTSCFNYRTATGKDTLSNHAYGCAIDINPQQNPYIWNTGEAWAWSHDNASPYIDRTSGDPHVIVSGDLCSAIFEKYGFSWGGYWENPIDYQHFEKRVF